MNEEDPIPRKRRRLTGSQCSGQDDLLSKLNLKGIIRAIDQDRSQNVEYIIQPGESFSGSPDAEDNVAVTATESSYATSKAQKPDKVHTITVYELLGRGGFGEAYKAYLSSAGGKVGRQICLKRAIQDREHAWETFIRENDIFSELHNHHHKHVIDRFFLCHYNRDDVNKYDKDDIFLGLEYFDGWPLNRHIKELTGKRNNNQDGSCIEHAHLHTILSQQASAIKHLQDNGIFHCDIKPDNILYNRNTKTSKLIDFGLAVLKHADSATFKSHGGTTDYMAPETIVNQELHTGSDLFGLAAALHHLIILEPPWHSVDGVKAVRDDKELSKKDKSHKIKRSIREEIKKFKRRFENGEVDIPMAIQKELMSFKYEESNITDIICQMLSFDPVVRPDCDVIIYQLENSTVTACKCKGSACSSGSFTMYRENQPSTSQSCSQPNLTLLNAPSSAPCSSNRLAHPTSEYSASCRSGVSGVEEVEGDGGLRAGRPSQYEKADPDTPLRPVLHQTQVGEEYQNTYVPNPNQSEFHKIESPQTIGSMCDGTLTPDTSINQQIAAPDDDDADNDEDIGGDL